MAISHKKMGLASKILLAMILGLAFGWIFKVYYETWQVVTNPIGEVFKFFYMQL